MSEITSVIKIIDEVSEEICDNYCKYSDLFKVIKSDIEMDELSEKFCDSCPLNKLR